MRTLAAILVVAGAALAPLGGARGNQDPSRQDRFADFLLNRMKDRLKLTDEQASKVKEILSKDTEDRAKLDEARTAKINEILDDEQKKQYEEMRRGFGGGGRGNFQFFQGGGPGGGQFRGGAMGQVQMDDLKRDLSLTEDQVQKISPILEEFNGNVQKRAEELGRGGFQALNFVEEIQKYQDNLKQVGEKIKAHLTDDQKGKLDTLMERATGWMRFLPMLQGRGDRGGGPPAGPRPSAEERARRAVEALKIEDEKERSAVSALVAKIVKAQSELEDYGKTARERLSDAVRNRDLSDQALEDRIKEVQEERRKREKEIAALQKQLAEVVSNRQEIELILQGILK